ncbi:carbon-nitrogen hydrolase family protein [Aliamphritea ceti]|uniref:carbon-nitrogen hydrolase family protein n=1 Tax=Aliamphritea ceti TaxID=1524258 RepID=UPI0021C432E3|nr:carbon-nitrogen hydrolase family protein [Aliamphritea ceti]
MRILACQVEIPATDSREQQLVHIHTLITKLDGILADNKVDLVLLPELATMEYSTENFKQIDCFAEPLEGASQQLFAELCRKHQVAVCYGMPRLDEDEYYISQVVLDRDGEYLTHYDKIHTAEYGDSAELKYFKRGDHLAVFELDGVKAGIIICYDMRFPELSRRLCCEFEADVILHPVAFAQDCSFHSWQQFVVSRALENQVYFVSLNRGGPHFGHSVICPPWIDESVKPTVMGEAEEFCIVEVDRQHTDQVRATIPFRKDALQSYQVLPVRSSKS